jgi:hypothetical protein
MCPRSVFYAERGILLKWGQIYKVITMTKIYLMTAAAALALGLTCQAGSVSAAPRAKTAGQLASPAQLQREHMRAVKAGDKANDPFDSTSSDDLNKQQLAKSQMLGTEPGVPDVAPSQNTALNGQADATAQTGLKTTDTSAIDASTLGSATNTTAGQDTTADPGTSALTPAPGNGPATIQNPIPVPDATNSQDKSNPTDGPSLKKSVMPEAQ